MRDYQRCEVRLVALDENDVLLSSSQGEPSGVTFDYFSDQDWWKNQGGNDE